MYLHNNQHSNYNALTYYRSDNIPLIALTFNYRNTDYSCIRNGSSQPIKTNYIIPHLYLF